MAEAIAEEYRSSLCDLNFNSKPHINMLTMLAEENVKYAAVIVKTIVEHVQKVPPTLKLPTLYLVDSIMKNIGGQYVDLFCDHLITVFSSVFEKVEELTRSQLYKLRQTWNDILPKKILYGIDCNVNLIDPAWPITAKVPTPVQTPPLQKSSIHVNPKFLGSPATKASVPLQNPIKPSLLKKNNLSNIDVSIKDKEFREILKKKEELGRQLKEKKEQVRALEMKKLEMAAKQKKNLNSSVLVQQNAQVKINTPRDPRLKKTNSSPLTNDKSNSSPTTLQSVVVVPSVKLPANEVVSNAGSGKPPQKPSSKSEKTVPSNKTFHSEAPQPLVANRRTANSVKKNLKGAVDNSRVSEKTPRDVPNVNRDHQNKTDKASSKKHSLSADEKPVSAPKRVCKPANKSKQPTKNDAVPTSAPAPVPETRVDTPILFGSEDKDYRQKPASNPVRQWTAPDITSQPNSRVPQEPFYPSQVPDKQTCEPNDNFFRRDGTLPPPAVTRRIPEDNYQTAKAPYNVDRVECDQFIRSETNIVKKINEPSSVVLKSEIPEQNYSLAPKPVPSLRVSPPPPPTKQFTLDGISYTLYFVDQHAFVVLDNNEPREVIFRGPPRLIHIEGQHQPILLGFDGRVIEFDTEGKRNTIRFGTPSKEVFVNDIPYEAQFGGPPFTSILNDNKPHWIKVEGPVPQVILNVPSKDLYDKFQMSRGIVKSAMPEPSMEMRDVDMRVKPSHPLVQTTIMPESTKDVDWRQLPSQLPPPPAWEGPQNAAVEPYNEYEPPLNGRNFQDYQNPPMAPNGPWNEGNGRLISDRGPPPNRNMDGPWARPGFRPLMQHERPMRPSPPHTWDMPPPPKIPANLVQSLPPMNTSRPPPTWNPLPPPPVFQGQIPDPIPTTISSLPPVSSNSNIMPVVQPVVPDVGAFFDKLVAAGIIPKASAATEQAKVTKPENPVKEEKVEIKKEPESKDLPEPEIILSSKVLRVHYPSVISVMYKGSQCATCGMRFKEIQSEQYSRHLDWHFRMNRREKDGAKKAYSRKPYYDVKNWVQFKEIEEKEERTPSYFELQAGGDSKTEEQQKIQSVPASECDSEKCAVCSEQFQLFWVEEEEEWHLRHAVRHDGEVYHPMCYEDFTRAEEIQKRMEEAKAKAEAEELAKKLEEEAAEKAKAEKEAAEKAKAEKEAAEKAEAEKEAAEKAKAEEEAAAAAAAAAAEMKVKENDSSEVKSESTEAVDVKKEPEESDESGMEVCVRVEGEEVSKSTLVPSESESIKEKEPPPPPPPLESFLSSDVDSDSFEDEFNPPTPDPRFQNLPKVERGKELSALCTIM